MRRFSYSGDISAENGGYFYCLDSYKDGYVDVVRITSCSDAGGPNNCWWVETLVVLVPEPGSKKEHDAINACGWLNDDAFDKAKGAARQRMILDAALSYGFYDPATCMTFPQSEIVQVGKEQEAYNYKREGPFFADTILRGNASIRNYALGRAKEI